MRGVSDFDVADAVDLESAARSAPACAGGTILGRFFGNKSGILEECTLEDMNTAQRAVPARIAKVVPTR